MPIPDLRWRSAIVSFGDISFICCQYVSISLDDYYKNWEIVHQDCLRISSFILVVGTYEDNYNNVLLLLCVI